VGKDMRGSGRGFLRWRRAIEDAMWHMAA